MPVDKNVTKPMPAVLMLAPFIGIIVPAILLMTITVINDRDLTFSIIFTIIGIVLFTAIYISRNKAWRRGLFRGSRAETISNRKVK